MNTIALNAQPMSTRTKVIAATFGAGALLTMGAMTVAFGNTEAHATSPTIGGPPTTTQTTAPSAPPIPVAKPSMTPKPFGKGWSWPS